MSASAIVIEHLTKTFPAIQGIRAFLWPRRSAGVEALRGVTLEVVQGEVFGLLGPNGGGKTTLLEILATNIGLTVAAYVFLARLVVQETLTRWVPTAEGYFPFVLVGMATNGAMFIAFTGLSRSLQLQQPAGLLKPLLMSQTRPEAVLLLSSLYPLVRAVVDLVVYLLVGWVFGGLSLAQANVLGAAVIACLAIVAFGSLGLCTAAFTVLLKYGNPLLWVIAGWM